VLVLPAGIALERTGVLKSTQYNSRVRRGIPESLMKKSLVLFAAAALLALQAFAADYWVVMKDGTRYKAKARPTVTGNRATIQMQSGSTLVVDASQIDVAKSEEVTRNGGGEGMAIEHRPTAMATQTQQNQ